MIAFQYCCCHCYCPISDRYTMAVLSSVLTTCLIFSLPRPWAVLKPELVLVTNCHHHVFDYSYSYGCAGGGCCCCCCGRRRHRSMSAGWTAMTLAVPPARLGCLCMVLLLAATTATATTTTTIPTAATATTAPLRTPLPLRHFCCLCLLPPPPPLL